MAVVALGETAARVLALQTRLENLNFDGDHVFINSKSGNLEFANLKCGNLESEKLESLNLESENFKSLNLKPCDLESSASIATENSDSEVSTNFSRFEESSQRKAICFPIVNHNCSSAMITGRGNDTIIENDVERNGTEDNNDTNDDKQRSDSGDGNSNCGNSDGGKEGDGNGDDGESVEGYTEDGNNRNGISDGGKSDNGNSDNGESKDGNNDTGESRDDNGDDEGSKDDNGENKQGNEDNAKSIDVNSNDGNNDIGKNDEDGTNDDKKDKGNTTWFRWIRFTAADKEPDPEPTAPDDPGGDQVQQVEQEEEAQAQEEKEMQERMREQEAFEKRKNEALLKHVVHALVHALGNDVKAKWTLHADSLGLTAGDAHPSAETEVTLAAVLEELKKIFQVDEAKIQEIIRGVSDNTEKLVPELALHLHVHEAKDLKMKSVSGSTNPYVTASLPWDTQKTRLLHQTRCPAWDQRFVMKVKDIQKEVLKLEVWHEHEHLGVGVVKDIRDLKGLGRLVKGTTAPDHLLLGSVTVPLKDVPEDGLESWFPLLKEDPQQPPALVPATSPPSHFSLSSQLAQLKTTGASLIHHGAQKQRGQLRVSVHFGPVQSSGPVPSGRNYEGLLVKAVLRHVDTPDGMVLWSGKLPPETLCALHITALVDGLRSDDKLLALWNAACRTPMSDSVWLAEILTRILQKDRKDMPSHAVPDIQASLLAWLSHAEDQLSHLHASFPPHRGVTSSHQLGGLLRGLRQLSRGSMSSELLKENIDVEEVVRKAVERHISQWWLALIERELRDTVSPDDQVLRVINITDECYDFIVQATSLYSPVFVCDFGLPYLRIAYLFITKKLNPCVRPLLMNIYSRLLSSSSSSDTKAGDSTNKDYALSAGSSLWQLYINLGRIHKQGASLPPEVRQESGVREYHRWFSKGVMHWLQVAQARIQRIISNAVEADQLVPCDEFCTFSSSATDAVTVFVGVRNWWLELAWPDPQNSGVLLGKILEDLCSCAIFYCDLLRHKVDRIYEEQQGEGKVFITKQICIGLNNMERVREEVSTLPESFKVPTLLASIAAADPNNKDGDRAAAEQFKGTFERLISSSMENMEAKVKEFVEAVVDKVSGTLLLGLTDACEAQDPDLLLGEVLDPGLSLMRHALTDACFRRFLLRLWESLLQLTRSLVVRSAERRRAEFFQAVHDTLTSSLQFFTPAGGLAMEEAMTDEYTSLIELLATLRLSSEQLIGQYYQERAEERQLMGVTSRGELFVNVFFTPSSKLVVEVVMARDFQVEDEVSSVSSRTSHVGLRGLVTGTTHVPVDAYVKVQLVPAELFPSAQTFSTKVLKRSDPAIFQETFTYVLSADDPQARAGYLLLTLKDHNVARANTFLGEAVVPLSGVPAVADESVASQPRTMQLKLTRPGIEAGYKPIATLRMRSSSDRVASAFVKKIAGRFADARLRKESRDLAPPGADDERSPEKGGRSPKIFDRIFKQES